MSVEGGKHCFPLMMYGFCSNNALYSTSLAFTIFFLTFNSFWYLKLLLFEIKSQPVDVYESVAYKNFPSCLFVFNPYFIGVILSEKCLIGYLFLDI